MSLGLEYNMLRVHQCRRRTLLCVSLWEKTVKRMSKCYYYDINFGRAKAYPLYVDSLSARRINCDVRSRQIQPHVCTQLISFSLLLDRNSPHSSYFLSSFPYYVNRLVSLRQLDFVYIFCSTTPTVVFRWLHRIVWLLRNYPNFRLLEQRHYCEQQLND